MPEAYELYDCKFVQWTSSTSAANALTVLCTTPVPAGKLWTIIGGVYYPSAAETRTVVFGIYNPSYVYPITKAESWAYVGNTNLGLSPVREGMEIKLYPGDYLFVARDVATAGSTMTIGFRFIESDLPLLRYVEPQRQVPSRRQAHSTGLRSTPSAGFGGPGTSPESAPSGGRRGGSELI